MAYDNSYYKELAFALRLRGLNDAHIKGTLEEVQSHTRISGGDPRSDFGSPTDYAEQFGPRKSSTTGMKFVTVATIAAVVAVVLQLVVSAASGVYARVGPFPVFMSIAGLLIVIGLVGGFLLDRRLPRGFKNQESTDD